MDIKTLLLAAVLVTTVYGCGFSLYKTDQKTFPGFGFWIASFFIFSLGYLSLLVRESIPLYLSIIAGNLCFAYGVLLRLDGVYRFTKNKSLKKGYYLTLVPFILSIGFFYFVVPDIVVRNLIISIYAAVIALVISYILTTTAPPLNKKFYYTAALLSALIGLSMVIGPILITRPPTASIFTMGNRYAIQYLLFLSYEISWGFCLLMMNSQRLEDELRKSEKDLRVSNIQLEKVIREKITLSGLLPICSHCKKIRDDKGYWNQLEAYIEIHSEADFSHSICPECATKYYPDIQLSDK
jgi:hypothetical protein